jgi:altronate hydrolase
MTVIDVFQVEDTDDVATALRDLAAGETVALARNLITLSADVPRGHKVAVRNVSSGSVVHKYGWPFGVATADITTGDHVHRHNVATQLGKGAPAPQGVARPRRHEEHGETFQGYKRADGRVGTRNEIWILCTVGCVGNTARRIAEGATRRFAGQVDGIFAFPHPFGCSQLGDDLARTRHILASLAAHPNAGGVLIVGLGCENNQLDSLLAELPTRDTGRLRSFAAQMVDDEIEAGISAVGELVAAMADDRRTECPLSDLVIGLKCGGSDGFSGITANPLVGYVSDAITSAGGSAILTEIPEIFGAEHLLVANAATLEIATRVGSLVKRFKDYFVAHGEPISENPSPGNITGGITTLEEKSLGAVQKAGRATVADVIEYGDRINRAGLTLLEAPGNDAVSSTALAAAGATVILFTTGRGTPLGFPVPTLKLASNSALAQQKNRWIDFDAGKVLEGEPMGVAFDRLLALVIATASGLETRSEQNGEREIAIWKRGVTL